MWTTDGRTDIAMTIPRRAATVAEGVKNANKGNKMSVMEYKGIFKEVYLYLQKDTFPVFGHMILWHLGIVHHGNQMYNYKHTDPYPTQYSNLQSNIDFPFVYPKFSRSEKNFTPQLGTKRNNILLNDWASEWVHECVLNGQAIATKLAIVWKHQTTYHYWDKVENSRVR